MEGLRLDFEERDLIMNGGFATTVIDSQNCALIALSQVCRITKPHVGEQIASKLQNRKRRAVSAVIAAAVRAVEKDGGKNVSITIDDNEQIQFKATYD